MHCSLDDLISPNSTLCEAADSPDRRVGDETQDEKNRQCDEHPDYDWRAIRVGRLEHVESSYRPNRDQGDADREHGRSGQNS